MKERLAPLPESLRHDSMRGWFAWSVYNQMVENQNIWVVVGDLGFGMFDRLRADFPERFINVGAAEQTLINVGVGLALEGKIPICYSITTFLLRRPFEAIRLYLDHDRIPVRLIGSGRERDYSHDGFTHWPEEDKQLMQILANIEARWPETKEEIPALVEQVIRIDKPWYINLRR